MVEVSECPACGGHTFQTLTTCIDNTASHETFTVKQCPTCLLAITTPRPDTEKLGFYYLSDEYISHSGKSSNGIDILYKLARAFALRQKEKLIKKYIIPSTLLDMGCGTGEFLHTTQKNGWTIEGVEPSEIARQKAEHLTGKKLFSSLEEVNQATYNVITAWHVLEHVPDVNQTLQKLKSLLTQNGIVFIAVPNYQSPDSMYYKNHWAGYDVPRHLWHFSKKSMQLILKRNSLELLEIKPMKLDAFYISLLSEKNKTEGALTLSAAIRAFISGLKSNLTAGKSINHSSLIYIAKNA
jgi:2-polyprenyl-3-methyl-5-hydroxy-6-metoxy-1,4-benzoquinol methylase